MHPHSMTWYEYALIRQLAWHDTHTSWAELRFLDTRALKACQDLRQAETRHMKNPQKTRFKFYDLISIESH